jgi:uncharacterized protein involved in exopolysaccharide biosynthesis
VGGVALHAGLPQTYSATASVQVEATGVDPLAQPAPHPVDMATEERIAASRGIAGSRSVEVSTAGESSVLRITHTGATPRGASSGANTVARDYLADRARRAADALARLRQTLDKQVEALPSNAPASQVQPLASDQARAHRLQTGGGTIIDAARPPDHGDLPGAPVLGVAGGLLGLLAATPLAALGARPVGPANRVIVLDVEPSATAELRQGAAALADHVLVLREFGPGLQIAEHWCRHLRSVGIPASVIQVDP